MLKVCGVATESFLNIQRSRVMQDVSSQRFPTLPLKSPPMEKSRACSHVTKPADFLQRDKPFASQQFTVPLTPAGVFGGAPHIASST